MDNDNISWTCKYCRKSTRSTKGGVKSSGESSRWVLFAFIPSHLIWRQISFFDVLIQCQFWSDIWSSRNHRSRDSGIDDNRDCCSCRQSSVSSRWIFHPFQPFITITIISNMISLMIRDSYGWPAVRCTRCCGCAANSSRRHRSSSPARCLHLSSILNATTMHNALKTIIWYSVVAWQGER